MTTNAMPETVDNRKLLQWTVIAAVLSAIVNTIVYFIAEAMGIFENVLVTMGGGSMAFVLPPVIGSSIMFILVGGALMWLIARFSQRPISIWRIVAIVGLILSLGMPFSPNAFANAPISFYVVLILMHIVAAIITIYLLTIRVQKSA
jgi:hypothetical protein